MLLHYLLHPVTSAIGKVNRGVLLDTSEMLIHPKTKQLRQDGFGIKYQRYEEMLPVVYPLPLSVIIHEAYVRELEQVKPFLFYCGKPKVGKSGLNEFFSKTKGKAV